jgi:hypothetical protein
MIMKHTDKPKHPVIKLVSLGTVSGMTRGFWFPASFENAPAPWQYQQPPPFIG